MERGRAPRPRSRLLQHHLRRPEPAAAFGTRPDPQGRGQGEGGLEGDLRPAAGLRCQVHAGAGRKAGAVFR
ncbi:hypothetical protein G6F63_017001 [Rhizopus arrhizus]|nr:hypothetical protein G6F63_017001 [Rhizopus arrhizus]